MQISLKEMANKTERELLTWFIPRRWVTIIDDVGDSVKTDTYRAAISWYGLQIHNAYPEVPYLIEEVVVSEVINDDYTSEPINNFLQRIMEDVDDPIETDYIKQLIYEWQIKLNNFYVILGQGGEVSASALDVEEIMSHDEIVDIRKRLKNNEITNGEGEAEFKEVMLHSETVPMVSLTLLNRTGGVNVNQVYQLAGERGAVFDMSNKILPNPIKVGFGDGIVGLADALGENRGAGKAITSNGKALEDAGWLQRRLQMGNSVIMGVDYMSDCGTKRLVDVKIDSIDHAKSLVGKYELRDDKIRVITQARARKLKRGDAIKMRSTAFCRHNKDGYYCGVCYGKLKASLPYNVIMWRSANPGMYSATEIAERIGQALLSTKHFLRHTTAIPFVVQPQDRDVISTDKNGDYIFLKESLKDCKIELTLDAINASDLTDLKGLDSLDGISEDQLKTFTSANISYMIPDPMIDGETRYERIVSTSVSSRSSRMSRELIEYALEHGWERQKRKMIIKLDDWVFTDPLFFLPYVHEDMNQYRVQIEGFLSFKTRNNVWLRREVTEEIFGEVLTELWTIINHKFKGVNILHPEILLTTLLTKDPTKGFYGLPEGDGPRYFVPFNKCVENRGMGALYQYQNQNGVIERVATYNVKGRSPSLMEADITPAIF